ncbi:hypothetical protein CXB51_028360 [Gossypium anomalum]|uniref:Uncharacterized protein n=1 Tax=Gossypium anomalum TaxID=47600 RepID=A0A8J5Y019_9ROSI|nr:hypothetical protein CXB51_028360 [Gossypium anomalum]
MASYNGQSMASFNHKSASLNHKPQDRHLVLIVTKQARIRRHKKLRCWYEGRGATDMAMLFVRCTKEQGCTCDVARPLVKAAAQGNSMVPEAKDAKIKFHERSDSRFGHCFSSGDPQA